MKNKSVLVGCLFILLLYSCTRRPDYEKATTTNSYFQVFQKEESFVRTVTALSSIAVFDSILKFNKVVDTHRIVIERINSAVLDSYRDKIKQLHQMMNNYLSVCQENKGLINDYSDFFIQLPSRLNGILEQKIEKADKVVNLFFGETVYKKLEEELLLQKYEEISMLLRQACDSIVRGENFCCTRLYMFILESYIREDEKCRTEISKEEFVIAFERDFNRLQEIFFSKNMCETFLGFLKNSFDMNEAYSEYIELLEAWKKVDKAKDLLVQEKLEDKQYTSEKSTAFEMTFKVLFMPEELENDYRRPRLYIIVLDGKGENYYLFNDENDYDAVAFRFWVVSEITYRYMANKFYRDCEYSSSKFTKNWQQYALEIEKYLPYVEKLPIHDEITDPKIKKLFNQVYYDWKNNTLTLNNKWYGDHSYYIGNENFHIERLENDGSAKYKEKYDSALTIARHTWFIR